ncbi:MAG TPA: hypothetical protein VGI04_13425, partial [Neobacillus sp.]
VVLLVLVGPFVGQESASATLQFLEFYYYPTIKAGRKSRNHPNFSKKSFHILHGNSFVAKTIPSSSR